MINFRTFVESFSIEDRARDVGAYRKAAGLPNANPHHPEQQKTLHRAYEDGYNNAVRDKRIKDPLANHKSKGIFK